MSRNECIRPSRQRKYEMLVNQSNNGAFYKVLIVPKSYKKKSMTNLLALAFLNALSFFIIRRYTVMIKNRETLAMVAFFLFSTTIFRKPKLESFIVLRNYGVQVTKVRGLVMFPDKWNKYLLADNEFIPRDAIVDIVINEGFVRGFQVIFYLAVIVKESAKLRLLFDVCITLQL